MELIKQINEEYKGEFITDFGKSHTAKEEKSGKEIAIGRYAVWGDKGKGKPEVIETSDDVAALQKKYGKLKIVSLKK